MGEAGGAREGAGCVGVDEERVGFFFGGFVAVVEFVPVALVRRCGVRGRLLVERMLLPRLTLLLEGAQRRRF